MALAELLQDFKARIFEDLNVCMPAAIVTYDSDTRRAVVQPLLKRKYTGRADPIDLPRIANVPVLQPRTASAQVRLPVATGDIVTLVFTDRALDKWLTGNGSARDPERTRAHDMTDAVAILGGPWPDRSEPVTDDEPTDLSIKYNDAEIVIESGGTVRIGAKAATKKAARDTDPTLINATTDAAIMTWFATVSTLLNTAGPVTGAPGTVVPPTSIVGKINGGSSQVRIDD